MKYDSYVTCYYLIICCSKLVSEGHFDKKTTDA